MHAKHSSEVVWLLLVVHSVVETKSLNLSELASKDSHITAINSTTISSPFPFPKMSIEIPATLPFAPELNRYITSSAAVKLVSYVYYNVEGLVPAGMDNE